MSRNYNKRGDRDRSVYVHGVRHERPDLRRLARVVIEFARAEAEAEAMAEHERKTADAAKSPKASRTTRPNNGAAA